MSFKERLTHLQKFTIMYHNESLFDLPATKKTKVYVFWKKYNERLVPVEHINYIY